MSALASHWICQTCGEPIASGEGIVEIANADPEVGPIGIYPVHGFVEPELPSDDGGFVDMASVADALQKTKPSLIFRVYHYPECNPDSENEGYWFTIDRATTLEEWVGWGIHLREKPWMTKRDLAQFLAFWWRHRGETYPNP